MTILSKPSGQQTRQDIILRLRKENEKEGCEQKADRRGRGSHLLSTAGGNHSPYCVCSESDYLQSLVLSESNPLIHWLFLIRVGKETSKSINIHYRKDPHQRDH